MEEMTNLSEHRGTPRNPPRLKLGQTLTVTLICLHGLHQASLLEMVHSRKTVCGKEGEKSPVLTRFVPSNELRKRHDGMRHEGIFGRKAHRGTRLELQGYRKTSERYSEFWEGAVPTGWPT